MANNKNKIIVKDQWAEKFLREYPFMPFGSICGLIGQAFQGKGISEKELRKLVNVAFELAEEFTERVYNKIEKESSEIEFPEKE